MKAKKTVLFAAAALLALGIWGCKSKPEPEPVDVASRLAEAHAANAAEIASRQGTQGTSSARTTNRSAYIK